MPKPTRPRPSESEIKDSIDSSCCKLTALQEIIDQLPHEFQLSKDAQYGLSLFVRDVADQLRELRESMSC